MNRMRRLLLPLFLAALVAAITPLTALAATDPFSGGSNTAGNFAVLAGSTVTNTGPTWITGQLGLDPGTSVTGFTYSTSPGPGVSGATHIGPSDAVAVLAKTDLTAAYNAAVQTCPAGQGTSGGDYSGLNLGNRTLGPGVYCQTTAPTLTGTLTLNGSGVYIFLIGTDAAPTTLITAAGAPSAPAATVVLTGGASPCQVFWRVTSSATIDTYTTFVGTIMALDSISMNTGATLNGRALAQTGAVTLQTNRIIQAAGCGYAAPTYVAPPAGTTLPATLAPSSPISGVPATPGLPATGVPSELSGGFPWLLVIGLGSGLAVVALGISSRRRRRRNT